MSNVSQEEPAITAPGGAVVTVSLESIYVLSLETRDNVLEVKRDVQALSAHADDHEGRIRHLERKIYAVSGVAALLGAGLSQVVEAIRV